MFAWALCARITERWRLWNEVASGGARDCGKVRAIGVSNFMVEHLTTLLEHATVVPTVNQIECHPYFQQPEVAAFGAEHGIVTQAWWPIGGLTFYRDGNHTSTLDDPVIGDIAKAHGNPPAQVMLRWGLQLRAAPGRVGVLLTHALPARRRRACRLRDTRSAAADKGHDRHLTRPA